MAISGQSAEMSIVDLSTLGGRISYAMGLKGWDAKRLAKELASEASSVGRWIVGERTPGGDMLMRMPGVLDVSGHWLLTRQGDMQPPQTPAGFDEAFAQGWDACAAQVQQAVKRPVTLSTVLKVHAKAKAPLRPSKRRHTG